MSRITKTVKVEDQTYIIKQLTTSEGLPLGHKLVQSLGPVLRNFLSGNSLDTELDENKIAAHVFMALENVPSHLLVEMGETFKRHTQFIADPSNGMKLPLDTGNIYDEHFAGRYGLWLKWVGEHVKLNFTGFFQSSGKSESTSEAGATTPPTS